jgi:hypothetical protein
LQGSGQTVPIDRRAHEIEHSTAAGLPVLVIITGSALSAAWSIKASSEFRASSMVFASMGRTSEFETALSLVLDYHVRMLLSKSAA